MKIKYLSLYRTTILFILFSTPLFSYPQKNNVGIALDSSMVNKPKMIPVINIIQKIEDANDEIRLTKKKLQPNISIVEIDSLYPLYATFIKKQKKQTDHFIKANPNRQKINNLIKKWEGFHDHLKIWQHSINDQQEKNQRLVHTIYFGEKTWELTYQNAIDEKAPYEILNTAKTILNEYKESKKSIVYQNNYLLRIDAKVSKQKTITNETIENLVSFKNSDIYNLFYLRHAPLWKAQNKSLEDDSESEIESFSENISDAFYFVKTNENSIPLYFIIVGFIIWLFIFIKKGYKKYPFNEEDGDLQKAKGIIVNHPITGIIFLSLVICKLYFTNTPTLLGDVLIFSMLIVSIPLVQPFMFNRFKNIIYYIILFYILDTVKTYIWFTTLQYRFYLLAEAFIVITILYLFTKPYLETIKMKLGRFGLFLIKLAPAMYLIAGISIISNILGYTNLTDLTLKIATQGSIITIIFYGVLMIFGGFSTGLIHHHYSSRGSFDVDEKFNLEKKALLFIRVITTLSWLFFFLQMIDFLTPLSDFLTDATSVIYNVGSITFTIGSILTFIFILVASFAITKFISFMIDGKSKLTRFLKLPKGVPAAISLIIRYFIIAFGFIMALSSLGINLGNFNLMAGALGLGIGFGLQNIISNFVSGLILVFERPLLPGDTVEVNNLLGTVNKVGIRASNISTFDGAEVVVPNNNLISNDLINWTLSDNKKRVEILIGTSYASDPNKILEILLEVANEYGDTIKSPKPKALFSDFGDSSLNFKLRFWVHYEIGLQAKSDISIGIYNRFKEEGIEIPFPQQDIHIKNLPQQESKIGLPNKKNDSTE